MNNRIFLVGCPRSGTTLLQTLIMSSANISSFPETHFFYNLFQARVNRFAKGFYAENLLSEWAYRSMSRKRNKKISLSLKAGIKSFVDYFDLLTREENKFGWIEKTPDHLRYIQHIKSYIPDARFIHILRPAKETIASLYEASHSWGSGLTAKHAAFYWLESVAISLRYLGNNEHLHVFYEDVLNNPESVINEVGKFLDMKMNYQGDLALRKHAEKVVSKDEKWKKVNMSSDNIKKDKPNKFYSALNEQQQNDILDILGQYSVHLGRLM